MNIDTLVRAYYRKHGITNFKAGKYELALQIFFKNFTKHDDVRSLTYIGWMLIFGCGCDRNHILASDIFQHAMTMGDNEAGKLLSFLYLFSIDIRYPDKKWAAWTIGNEPIMDLNLEDSF
jgi:hypothetical protein